MAAGGIVTIRYGRTAWNAASQRNVARVKQRDTPCHTGKERLFRHNPLNLNEIPFKVEGMARSVPEGRAHPLPERLH